MSQTEELRAELDRRKIKWWEDAWDSSHRTIFDGENGVRYCAYEFFEILYLKTELPVTVEQAISATVGVGTCRGEIDTDHFDCKLTTFTCKSCGWSGVIDDGYAGYSFGDTDMPRHCPNCGRRIVG